MFASSRRGVILLAAALTMSGAAMAQSTTITFRFNDTEEKEMRAALDQFEKQNSGIKVTLQRIGWRDARNQFLREAAVGQGPDVVHSAQVWVKEMGDAGATLALDSLLQQSPPPNEFADFVAQDLAKNSSGKLVGLPWTTDTWAMVYRSDLLREAGIAALPQTWAELRQASTEIFKKTGKAGFGFPAGSSASGAIWFLATSYWWSNGKALIVAKNDGSFDIGLTAEDIADCMKYFKSFVDAGDNPKANLAASDAHDPSILQALVTGNQAIGSMPPNTYKQVLEAYTAANPGKPLPFVSGPFPKGSITRSSNIGGRMLVINAHTKHPEAAWKFVKYMSSEEVFSKFYRTQFPAQRTLLKKVDFGPELKGFAEQLEYARSWGAYANGPIPIGTLWNLAGRGFGVALSGQRSADDAAKELLQEVRKLMPQKS